MKPSTGCGTRLYTAGCSAFGQGPRAAHGEGRGTHVLLMRGPRQTALFLLAVSGGREASDRDILTRTTMDGFLVWVDWTATCATLAVQKNFAK